jgi:hypothetical protein
MPKKPSPPRHKPVKNLTTKELEVEIATLPSKIAEATALRNRLWFGLRSKWSVAFSNSSEFVTLSNQTEAAGKEVMVLTYRLVQASRMFHERTSGRLGEEI